MTAAAVPFSRCPHPGCPMDGSSVVLLWFRNTIAKRPRGACILRSGGDFDDGVVSVAVTVCKCV